MTCCCCAQPLSRHPCRGGMRLELASGACDEPDDEDDDEDEKDEASSGAAPLDCDALSSDWCCGFWLT